MYPRCSVSNHELPVYQSQGLYATDDVYIEIFPTSEEDTDQDGLLECFTTLTGISS